MSIDIATDLNNICRCCLRSGVLKSIFSGNKTKTNVLYHEMIEYCCELSVSENDGLPAHICTNCVTKLKSSYKFKQKCIQSNTELFNCRAKTLKYEKIRLPIDLEKLSESYELSHGEDGEYCADDELFILENHNENFEHLKDIKTEIKSENDKNVDIETNYIEFEVGNINNDNAANEILDENVNISELVDKKKKHYKTKEKINGSQITNQKKRLKFDCEICGQFFFKSTNLQKHINWIHYGIKPYHCSICNKDYMSEKQHREVHTNSFSATCDQCGKTYTARQSYKNHMESHGNKEYLCECGITFKVKAFFNNHVKLVHAPKKFMCHFCSKAFTMKGILISHLRVHTGEKPFECQLCHQKFRKKAMLKRHIQGKHSDVRTFQCQQCHKEFKTRNVLGKHMIVHRVRQFACRVCQKPFGRVDNRNVHERSVHSISREEAKLMWPS